MDLKERQGARWREPRMEPSESGVKGWVSSRAPQNLHSKQWWQQKQGAELRSALWKQPERRCFFRGWGVIQAVPLGTQTDSGSRLTGEASAYCLGEVVHGKSLVTSQTRKPQLRP